MTAAGAVLMPIMPADREVPLEELESKYNQITELYDFAGELIDTVESTFVKNPEAQWQAIEPLVHELGEATDALAEEYIHIAESLKKNAANTRASKARIEASLRRIYAAITEYRSRVQNHAKKAYDAIMNIADPIVDKIQRHVEKLVVIFMESVAVSLANIMSKTEQDQLKERQTRVAFMLHQMSQQQG